MRKRKGKIDIEVDGFVVLLIGIFVVLPALKIFFGGDDKKDKKTRPKETAQVVETVTPSSRATLLKVDNNSASAPKNTEVKLPVGKKAVKIVATFSDEEEIQGTIKSSLGYIVFTKEGDWEINTYDAHGLAVDWVRVNVY